MWVYAAGAPLAGLIGDRWRIKDLIFGGCIFWSFVTITTSWCGKLWHFVTARAQRLRRNVLFSGVDVAGQRLPRPAHAFARAVVSSVERLHRDDSGKHEGVYIESRKPQFGGVWTFLGINSGSPHEDDAVLQAGGQPETREYRMRFWDRGQANGDWSAVRQVTVR